MVSAVCLVDFLNLGLHTNRQGSNFLTLHVDSKVPMFDGMKKLELCKNVRLGEEMVVVCYFLFFFPVQEIQK